MADSLLSIVDLVCGFETDLPVVNGVSLELAEGARVGLVGESGSGKTTLARAALGLVMLSSGRVTYRGVDIRADSRRVRSECRMVFQNTEAMLNPGLRVGAILDEPLRIYGTLSAAERRQRVREVLTRVGGDERWLRRRPRQLSGGERRRVALARALVHPPRLLVADEPVAGLDVVRQCEILDILEPELRSRDGGALIISHDLAVVERLCTEIHVMQRGTIVDTMRRVGGGWTSPHHDYARRLIEASVSLRSDFAKVGR